MVVQVLLALDRPETEALVRHALANPDMVLRRTMPDRPLWDQVRQTHDLVVISHSLLGHAALDGIRALRLQSNPPSVVILTDSMDPSESAAFLAAGCNAVLDPSLVNGTLEQIFQSILSRRRQEWEEEYAGRRGDSPPSLNDFTSCAPAMQNFMAMVRHVVDADTSLLMLGETGVGKERLARAIHAESRRNRGPFVPIHCGALPETLLESELFGHEKGAFTGATASRRGLFELAEGGTIFLDEVGDMPPHLQVKLLRFLQEHEVLRVGSERPVRVDARVMGATNRDLPKEVEGGKFREDLYFRLSVVTLTIPPLRERREEIPFLVQKLINAFQSRLGRQVQGINPDALEALIRYPWPGNIRELMNNIERAVLLCDEDRIALAHLPESIRKAQSAPPHVGHIHPCAPNGFPEEWMQKPLSEASRDILERFEQTYLSTLLRTTHGRIGETARRAGIHPRSLYAKMKRYGLHKEDFRPGRCR
ncbi:MAG: sigma-54-dependent Fis family transcriptional regulator [Planctomycetes bacterium]|nr:sigma-54-dependent Fis family transcriptional regulator [Planctomycetota bacterium]